MKLVLLDIGLLVVLPLLWALERRTSRWVVRRAAERAGTPVCTATRIYNFTGSKTFKCRLMHGRKATCCLTEDHSDGSLYLHWDPVWKCSWASGPEAFK